MSDLELVDCLRADILAAQQQQPEENDSSFYGNRNKINASAEIVALIKGDVDAIFLKGAHAAQIAHDFALHTIIDIGSHPDPILRSNNGTPRTLTVDEDFLTQYPEQAQAIVDAVLQAEHGLMPIPMKPIVIWQKSVIAVNNGFMRRMVQMRI